MECKGDCLFNIDGKCTRQSKKDMTAIGKWKNDFKGFISELSMPEDDFYGIMQYIDEAPIDDVFDKIKAEIEAEITHNLSDEQTQAFAYVLQIIDKYKAESEDKK